MVCEYGMYRFGDDWDNVALILFFSMVSGV